MNPSHGIFKVTESTSFRHLLRHLEILSLRELQAQPQNEAPEGKENFLEEGIIHLLMPPVCESSLHVESTAFGTGSGVGASSSNHFPGFSKRNQNNVCEVIVPKSPLGILGAFPSSSNWFQHAISRSLLNILRTFSLRENKST